MTQEPDIKRWIAKRKVELIKQIYRGQTTVPEVARHYDLIQQGDREVEGGCRGGHGECSEGQSEGYRRAIRSSAVRSQGSPR